MNIFKCEVCSSEAPCYFNVNDDAVTDLEHCPVDISMDAEWVKIEPREENADDEENVSMPVDFAVKSFVADALVEAKEKHPEFPSDPHKALAIINEEFLELVQAVNDGKNNGHIIEEASHVAVTAIRFIENML